MDTSDDSSSRPRVGIAVITRDRRDVLLTTLAHLVASVPADQVVVVDNGSGDGTVEAVARRFPEVRVVPLSDNLGAAARNVAARELDTEFVAFSDDDSWWSDGALQAAVEQFDRHPRLGLLAARVVVEPHGTIDPVARVMARSPLGTAPDLPGPSVLGFVACGVVMRRAAFLDAGGFNARYGIGGEERLLAIDLAARGWGQAYVDAVVAHHAPGHRGNRSGRRRRVVRNDLWTAALRSSMTTVAGMLARRARSAVHDPDVRHGLFAALVGAPWVVRERRRAPPGVLCQLRRIDDDRPGDTA